MACSPGLPLIGGRRRAQLGSERDASSIAAATWPAEAVVSPLQPVVKVDRK